MKLLKLAVLFLFMGVISIGGKSQQVKIIEGDLSALKGETKVNTEFTYDHMSVGKFDNEADYIKYKKDEYNKKEAGRGDKWEKDWVLDRKDKFEPRFNELITKASDIVVTGTTKDARYTFIFNTIFTEPGFSAGWPVRKSAEVSGEVILVKASNKEKVLARISIEKAPGGGYAGFDFDTGTRIMAAYGKAGLGLGKLLKKEIK